jgi:hypothetical protein
MSSYPRDVSYDITPVKNPGKSKGHKGTAPSKTPSVPNLINPGTYVNTKVSQSAHTPNGYHGSGTKAPALGQGVQYVGAKKPGKSSISELPGQYTKMPKPGGR